MFFFALLVFRIGDDCIGSMEKCPNHTKFVLKGVVWNKREKLRVIDLYELAYSKH